jgi:CYTH domain-containing protein
MAVEIERKFLVRDDSWRRLVAKQQEIREGLIAVADGRKVRVRICDQQATLTVKSRTTVLASAEFEYEIPLADGEELLAQHCLCAGLAKTRYFVPHGQLSWQVDVYTGLLAGVTLAEVELSSETEELPLPSWAGSEVTGDPAYRKINLVSARMGSRSSVLQCLV